MYSGITTITMLFTLLWTYGIWKQRTIRAKETETDTQLPLKTEKQINVYSQRVPPLRLDIKNQPTQRDNFCSILPFFTSRSLVYYNGTLYPHSFPYTCYHFVRLLEKQSLDLLLVWLAVTLQTMNTASVRMCWPFLFWSSVNNHWHVQRSVRVQHLHSYHGL